MGALWLLVAILLALVAAVFVLAVLGGHVASRVGRGAAPGPRLWPWVLLCGATLVVLVALPFGAAARAEAGNGWVDRDGDGMQDGFVNGGYDWFDVNAGDTGGWWLAGLGATAAAFAGGSLLILRAERRQAGARARSVASVAASAG